MAEKVAPALETMESEVVSNQMDAVSISKKTRCNGGDNVSYASGSGGSAPSNKSSRVSASSDALQSVVPSTEVMQSGADNVAFINGVNSIIAGTNYRNAGADGNVSVANDTVAGANGTAADAVGFSAGADAVGFSAGADTVGFSADAVGFSAGADGGDGNAFGCVNVPTDVTSSDDNRDAGGLGLGRMALSSSSSDMHQGRYVPQTKGVLNTHRDSYYYTMNSMGGKPRGHCLIFNHKHFDKHLGMNDRSGTNRDRDEIRRLFVSLGFLVKVFDDLRYDDLKEQIEQYSKDVDHSSYECFVLFFLSHGEEGLFYAKDTSFKHDMIFKAFEGDSCVTLAGKPKMFFIQACRGGKLDHGIEMIDQTDAGGSSHKLPVTADCFTMWSTVPGYYSWRNTCNGSWFIQSLVHVFKTEMHRMDLASMHACINRHMINNFESNVPGDRGMHKKKQVSSMVSTATRFIHFFPQNTSQNI